MSLQKWCVWQANVPIIISYRQRKSLEYLVVGRGIDKHWPIENRRSGSSLHTRGMATLNGGLDKMLVDARGWESRCRRIGRAFGRGLAATLFLLASRFPMPLIAIPTYPLHLFLDTCPKFFFSFCLFSCSCPPNNLLRNKSCTLFCTKANIHLRPTSNHVR